MEATKDLFIAGGGLGGVAAALSACENGLQVVLIEETDWLGGQVTSQGVPPDEHPWIEKFGCTNRYRKYRNKVREKYTMMLGKDIEQPVLNPGNALVSNIAHDPRVALHVFEEMLLPYVLSNQLTVNVNSQVVSVEKKGKQIEQIVYKNILSGDTETITARYYIDATETGEMLPLADIDYVTGSEAKSETGELHALDEANSEDIQAFTYVLGMEYRPDENHIIPKPDMYDFWKEFHPDIWPEKYLSFVAPHPITKEKRQYTLLRENTGFPLWEYRRIYDYQQFARNFPSGDISLMNWPMNDYFLGNIYEVSKKEKEKHIYQSKQLSLSLLYWLQTEAPNPYGDKGYPGLMLRKDIFGTSDGLAKAAYVRESRRIKAEYTIVEQDLSPDENDGKVGKKYNDRVGIGSYSIDLHPSMTGRNYLDIKALPFHIPLGALLPKNMDNILAGNKNIGSTHITNGCYRLHPVEWNIGEVCGSLAAFCIRHSVTPKLIRSDIQILKQFQQQLRNEGIELEWPEEFYQ